MAQKGPERMGYGRYYEEFQVGDLYQHWPGRTLTEHDNTWYALMSMDLNPLWIDAEYAKGTEFGRRPIVDSLVFSLAVGMSVGDTSGKTIANLGFERVLFEQPLFPGDSLYSESRVLEKRESKSKPDRGIIYLETTAHNQNRDRILVFRRRFLAPKRPS